MSENITLSKTQREIVAGRIRAGQAWLDHRQRLTDADIGKFSNRSERNLALVSGRYWEKANPTGKVLSINHLLTAVSVKLALATSGDTLFIGTPREPQFEEFLPVAEGLLNTAWDAQGFDARCDRAQWDSMVHPTGGVVEVGWVYKDASIEQVGQRPEELEIAEADVLNSDTDAMMLPPEVLAGMAPEMPPVPQELLQESAVGARWDNKPEVDRPFVERFDPRTLIVDPACTTWTLADARYVFRHKWPLLSDVKSSKRFRGTGKLKGAVYNYDPDRKDKTQPSDIQADDIKRVELWDGYSYLKLQGEEERRYHVVFCKETQQELLCEEEPYPYFEGDNPFPFEIMPGFTPDNDSLDMLPDVERARDMQVADDLAFTQLEWARAHSPNVLLVPEGTFAGEEGERTRNRIESGQEHAVLEVDPAFIREVKWMDRPELHQDAYETLASTPGKMMQVIGVNEYQANILPAKEMTRAETNQLASQGGTRQDAEVERYYHFIEAVAYKVLTLFQMFQVRDTQFSFTAPNGEKQWGTANVENLRGVMPETQTPENPIGQLERPGFQFKIALDVSKRKAKNQALEQENMVKTLQALTPFAQMPDPRLPNRPMVNMPGVLRHFLKELEIGDVDEMVFPDPTPEEVQAFQEQQAMQAQQEQEMVENQSEQDDQRAEADRESKMEMEAMRLRSKGR